MPAETVWYKAKADMCFLSIFPCLRHHHATTKPLLFLLTAYFYLKGHFGVFLNLALHDILRFMKNIIMCQCISNVVCSLK